jgi:hypothetical protein
LIFVTSAPSWLWDLDTQRLILKRVFIPFSTVALLALAGDEKKAFGILDNRSLQSYYPDLVPFEFAVFDLQAETATRQDFAPIEKELVTSGFKMETLKLQPSSTGKVIVSDGEKAAFLEFSDDM